MKYWVSAMTYVALPIAFPVPVADGVLQSPWVGVQTRGSVPQHPRRQSPGSGGRGHHGWIRLYREQVRSFFQVCEVRI